MVIPTMKRYIDGFKKHLLTKHLDARHPVYLHGFMHLCIEYRMSSLSG